MKNRIAFNRNEVAGAFGDLGTDLPLVIGMLLASPMGSGTVLIVFGAMQILTGLVYRLPMPVQPLKAVALIVITQNVAPDIIHGGGLAVGIVMLLLTVTGLIVWLGKIIPKVVIRGIQFGLGVSLAMVALKTYIPSDGVPGYALAAIAFVIVLVLLGHRKYPPALLVVGLGIIYAIAFSFDWTKTITPHFLLPTISVPSVDSIWSGFLLLALPQIPLSLGNSIYATRQIITDYFPDRSVSVRKIGFTYSIMNIVSAFLGGIPVCHGSGGLAGHYTFGGRTGGSVVIYGSLFLIGGLVFSQHFADVFTLFPKPILGVILLFEGLALMNLIRDVSDDKRELMLALIVGLLAAGLPYGFLIGMLVGIAVYWINRWFRDDSTSSHDSVGQ